MTLHIAAINGLNLAPGEYQVAKSREDTIRCMADHLVAGAAGTLDLNQDRDVIQYLMDAPEQFRWKVIRPHLEAALDEARQTIAVATEMARV
jgi:hypothetical protein